MATGLNRVSLIGNLGKDPEVRYTPKGTAVGDIGLAINRTFTTDTGERQEDSTFVEATLWGLTAGLAQQYLHKGRPVYIEGRLQMDTWEDRNTGQKRSKLKVVAENMQFLGSRGDGEGGGGNYSGGSSSGSSGGYDRPQRSAGGGGGRPAPQRPPARQDDDFGEGPITEGLDDDDIPF